MSRLATIARKLIGLFIEDGALAASLIAWLALCGWALPRLGLPPLAPPSILAAGCLATLVLSVLRA